VPQICYPDGRLAVALPGDGRIYLLSADSPSNRVIILPSGADTAVQVTRSMAYVRVSKRGQPIYGYDLATGRLVWKVPAPGSPDTSAPAAFDGGFSLLQAPRNVFRVFEGAPMP
jgi:outer membrane protein assembly factor BamB